MITSEIRANARRALDGKWGKGALIILCYLLIMLFISFVLGIIPFVGSIISLAISVPIAYGIIATFIKLKRGEEVLFTGFLEEGFSKFGKAWGIFGYTILKLLIPFILIVVFTGIDVYTSFNLVMNGSLDSGIAVISSISSVLEIIVTIYMISKGLLYALSYAILYDNPNMSSKEIVEESARLIKGNRWKYIWLELSFLGWMILSIFTLCIGLLWLSPYMTVSIICFYEALAGKNQNQQVEIPEEEINPISE